MTKISLEQIEYLLPSKSIKLKEKYPKISQKFLKEKIGALNLPRFSHNDSIVKICTKLTKKKN